MYEIWTVTHGRSTPYINCKTIQIWIRQNDMFLIYVTLNTLLLKLTELADRTYKNIFKRIHRTTKHSFGKRTKQIF